VCRYIWHSVGSLGWQFSVLKYKYIFQVKYTEVILSISTRNLLWFEITKIPIAVSEKKIIVFIIIFGTLSFLMSRSTQPCIPPGSVNRVPTSAGVRTGMSPLSGGR